MANVVEMIRGLHADLILCDALRAFEVVVALKAGSRCAIYSVTLPIWSDALGPAVYTAIPEPRSWCTRLRVVSSWKLNETRQWLNRRRWAMKYGRFGLPPSQPLSAPGAGGARDSRTGY